jgi:hypothetical protein
MPENPGSMVLMLVPVLRSTHPQKDRSMFMHQTKLRFSLRLSPNNNTRRLPSQSFGTGTVEGTVGDE